MDFNYYVYQKKAYISRREIAEKYGMKLAVVTFLLQEQKDIPRVNIDREIFYQIGPVSSFMNERTGMDIVWR